MLVALTVTLATSYYVANRLGQPVLLGTAAGGIIGLISSLIVGDAPIAQMGPESAGMRFRTRPVWVSGCSWGRIGRSH